MSAGLLQRRPGLRVGLLLSPPMLWLGVAYLAALGALFLTAFWGSTPKPGKRVAGEPFTRAEGKRP